MLMSWSYCSSNRGINKEKNRVAPQVKNKMLPTRICKKELAHKAQILFTKIENRQQKQLQIKLRKSRQKGKI